jgi:response regulator RpfG family c-di-GMP phosphodiesterase
MLVVTALVWNQVIMAQAHRLARPAQAMPSLLELSKEKVHHVDLAALLHDLRKLLIHKAILHKHGP